MAVLFSVWGYAVTVVELLRGHHVRPGHRPGHPGNPMDVAALFFWRASSRLVVRGSTCSPPRPCNSFSWPPRSGGGSPGDARGSAGTPAGWLPPPGWGRRRGARPWAVVAPVLQSIGGAATWGDAFMLVGSLVGQLLAGPAEDGAWPTDR